MARERGFELGGSSFVLLGAWIRLLVGGEADKDEQASFASPTQNNGEE